jgi:hypothetical protein
MNPCSKNPLIYEINTWVWLAELAHRHGRAVTLADVPDVEWETLAGLGLDAVWLMGVWERSPAGTDIARHDPDLQAGFRRVLPDLAEQDVVGSPYCVRRYAVDAHLGGPAGLAVARERLAAHGLRLILDFVPNHVAPDHPWVQEHPAYFITGGRDDRERDPSSFREVEGRVLACGRDPYFPAWPDVLQLNAFDEGLRAAARETLVAIAGQCDGVRCDMAMLVMNDVFERTWGARAGRSPQADYWPTLIDAVRARYPDFRFIAEAYWGLEWALQQQGFDYCYDKGLYDRLGHGSAEIVRLHLTADLDYQQRLVRFIENHDEARAAAVFPPERHRVVAVAAMTLPGARLLHEGQLDGRRVRLPIFLGRRPAEPPDEDLQGFYRHLLALVRREALRNGEWRLCERRGWPDNPSTENLLAWCWEGGGERYLVVVNLSGASSQARVPVPWADLPGRACTLSEVFSGERYERPGDEMHGPGLFVDLAPWGLHCFRVAAG